LLHYTVVATVFLATSGSRFGLCEKTNPLDIIQHQGDCLV